MKQEDHDIMRKWFDAMPDESLPFRFNEKVMEKVRKEALTREKRNRRLELFGYISGAVAMLAICVTLLYGFGLLPNTTVDDSSDRTSRTSTFERPTFGRPDFEVPTFKAIMSDSLAVEWSKWKFSKSNVNFFQSQSFLLSVYVGILAMLLLFADSTIRRRLNKTKHN